MFFLIILAISIVFQTAFVQINGVAKIMKMKPLTWAMYGITVAIGFSCIIFGLALRLLPLRWFGNLQIKEDPLTDEQESNSLVSKLRKSHR